MDQKNDNHINDIFRLTQKAALLDTDKRSMFSFDREQSTLKMGFKKVKWRMITEKPFDKIKKRFDRCKSKGGQANKRYTQIIAEDGTANPVLRLRRNAEKFWLKNIGNGSITARTI